MKTLTVAEIARLCGATLDSDSSKSNGVDASERSIVGPATLAEAGPDHVSFLGNQRYLPELETTRAGAVLVPTDLEGTRDDLPLLRCENPSRAFTQVIEAFRPPADHPEAGVHPTAAIDANVELGAGVSIGAHCAIAAGAVLGDGVVLYPGTVVGRGARIGDGSVLYPSVVVYAGVEIGARCIIHAGTVLGSDGFGFEPTAEGWEKIPQCGNVVVEDDVEIGANVAIDRGRFGATRIGAGAKLDNLVHVAHNVDVGAGALLIAQVGIAGSAKVGDRAILAGQVGVVGHVEIGPGARISAKSGVSRDLEGNADYFGTPARPQSEALRAVAAQARVPELIRRVRELERRLEEKEEEA